MSNARKLTEAERKTARRILEDVRKRIADGSGGDAALVWAMRRYIYIRLQYDERGSPIHRRLLKLKKMVAQKGKCALCGVELPERGAELDRFDPMKGYTKENTQVVCQKCHREGQAKRQFA